jgi:hypothetical protein
MEKKNLTQNLKEKSWLISLCLLVVLFVQNCSNTKKYNTLKKEVTLQTKRVDSLPTRKDLKIEGLEISKRMLYDNNAVIRTAIRPDDRMNQYDEEIKKIQTNE